MTEAGKLETGSSLDEMMERHFAARLAIIDAVRQWDGPRTDGKISTVAYANALLDVAREEGAAGAELSSCLKERTTSMIIPFPEGCLTSATLLVPASFR